MRWRRYYLGGAIIPPIDAREPEDGAYVITQVTRKARQWRTNPQSHTTNQYLNTWARFFQQTR